jgi:hypothetical protein
MTGKKKGKVKFRNAEEARRARELAADWEKLKTKWAVPPKEKKMGKIRDSLQSSGYRLTTPPGRTTTHNIPSRNTGDGIASSKAVPQYTGTKMLGIGVMHKSNSVPIFSDEEAVEIATMRRG